MDFYIAKNCVFHEYRKDAPAAAVCQSDDTVTFQTKDAANDMLQDDRYTFAELNIEKYNPVTGPLYVKDALPGDILKVDILDIRTADRGNLGVFPHAGPMRHHFAKETVKRVPILAGKASVNDRVPVCMDPMIGCIGTAPAGEPVPSPEPGVFGGNMDCTEIRSGTTLYLPVAVEGALLFIGDLHAVMGDGEVSGMALEVAGEVDVRVSVVKNTSFPMPMLVTKDKIIHISSHVDLDTATHDAINMSLDFLVDTVGMDVYEAGMYLSMVGNAAICQIVNPLMTARMEMPKDILDAYGCTLP